MNTKSRLFIKIVIGFILLGSSEILYLAQSQRITPSSLAQKKSFVSLTRLPDLAISNEASFVRHRSLSTIFDIYRDGEGLRSYFPSSSIYWHSTIVNQTPSKVMQ